MPVMGGIELLRAIRDDDETLVASGRGRERSWQRRGPAAGTRGRGRCLHRQGGVRPARPSSRRSGGCSPGEQRRPRDPDPRLRRLGHVRAAGLPTSSRRTPISRSSGPARAARQPLAAVPRVSPDLVTMDLEMPGMGGVRAVEQIMRDHAGPDPRGQRVRRRGSALAAEALAAGALEAIAKDHLRLDDLESLSAVALRQKLRRLARATVKRPSSVPPGSRPGPLARPPRHGHHRDRHLRIHRRPRRPRKRCSGVCQPTSRSRFSWSSTSPRASWTGWCGGWTTRVPLPVGRTQRRAARRSRSLVRPRRRAPAPR